MPGSSEVPAGLFEGVSAYIVGELGMPFQLSDGEWRSAYAHGHSIKLTPDEVEYLKKRQTTKLQRT